MENKFYCKVIENIKNMRNSNNRLFILNKNSIKKEGFSQLMKRIVDT